jgi:hypothetical protein
LRRQVALYLGVNLTRGGDVLRIHLSHHELAEQLHLLHLGERYFVADLNRLQVANRSLVLKLETGEVRLLGREVLGLGLHGSERTIERIQRRVDLRLWALGSRSRGNLIAGIALLELRRETIEGVGKPLLLADQAAEVIKQALVGLPKAGTTASGVLNGTEAARPGW